jgi:hypothetical protein
MSLAKESKTIRIFVTPVFFEEWESFCKQRNLKKAPALKKMMKWVMSASEDIQREATGQSQYKNAPDDDGDDVIGEHDAPTEGPDDSKSGKSIPLKYPGGGRRKPHR